MEKVYQTIRGHISQVPTETGCLEWLGYCDKDGYGLKSFYLDGRYKTFRSHRLAYQSIHGDIPEGLVVRHTCDNPSCCNPDHLTIGTHRENIQDKLDRGRAAGGRNTGAKNPNSKLTEQHVREIRSSAESNKRLAAQYGVSNVLIGLVKRNLIWRHVNEVPH